MLNVLGRMVLIIMAMALGIAGLVAINSPGGQGIIAIVIAVVLFFLGVKPRKKKKDSS